MHGTTATGYLIGRDIFAAIERRAIEIAARLAARDGPYHAEVVPGCEPHWHLIETLPNMEFKALRFLADRRFGVFLPQFADSASARGRNGDELCNGRRLIFPGRLFVFCWNVALHWRRILACPGVKRVMCDAWEHPAVVPDRVIDAAQVAQYCHIPARRGRKRYRRTQAEQENYFSVRLRPFSRLHDDPDIRVAALDQAAGVATVNRRC